MSHIAKSNRSKAPSKVVGPKVGAFVTPEGVVVRVVNGMAPSVDRFSARADSEDAADIASAARLVAARIERAALVPIAVTVDV